MIKKIIKFFSQKYFVYFFNTAIIVNILCLLIFWHRQEKETFNSINLISQICLCIITFQISIEVLERGPIFFTKFIKIYDATTIIISFINFSIEKHYAEDSLLRFVNSVLIIYIKKAYYIFSNFRIIIK